MASTTTSAAKMKKIKVKMTTTLEPHEIDYVDVELFPEDEEMKIGMGKVLLLFDRAFHIYD